MIFAGPSQWTAIENVNFKDFVQRAATATMRLTEFYLATSYKMYSMTNHVSSFQARSTTIEVYDQSSNMQVEEDLVV